MSKKWILESKMNDYVDRIVNGIISGELSVEKVPDGEGISRGAIAEFLGIGLEDAREVGYKVTSLVQAWQSRKTLSN